MTPTEAVQAFILAAMDKNVGRVKALVTKDGWKSKGTSAFNAYRVLTKLPLLPRPNSEYVSGKRAVVGVGLYHVERLVQTMWILLEKKYGTWRLAGSSSSDNHCGLFLSGRLRARVDWDSLPEFPPAREWGEQLARALMDVEPLPEDTPHATKTMLGPIRPFVRRGVTEIVVKQAGILEDLGRAIVCLELVREEEDPYVRWVALDVQDGGTLQPVSLYTKRKPQLLLQGFDWDRDTSGQTGKEPTKAVRST